MGILCYLATSAAPAATASLRVGGTNSKVFVLPCANRKELLISIIVIKEASVLRGIRTDMILCSEICSCGSTGGGTLLQQESSELM